MKHFLVIFAVVLSTITVAVAQKKNAINVEFDKKVLYVDSMKISNSSSVQRLISILPEMLNRPGTTLISNYDIKLNGLSLGDAADAAIMQLQLADVEKIEVSESSASSYLNNGQGGSINIILRNAPYSYSNVKDTMSDKKFWGSANIGGLYQPAVLPSFRLNWRNDNITLHTIAIGCLDKTSDDESTTSPSSVMTESTDRHICYQFVGGYLNNWLTPKDQLEIKFSERASRKQNTTDGTLVNANSSTQTVFAADTSRSLEIHALAHYKHLFKYITFESEFQYAYNNTTGGLCDIDTYGQGWDLWTTKHSTNLSGNIKLVGNLYSGPRNDYGRLTLAVDLNYNKIKDHQNDLAMDHSDADYWKSEGHTMYVMPYISWECRFRNFLLKAQAEYQYFKNSFDVIDIDYVDNSYNDFTGMLVMQQQLGKSHNLRLMYTRKIQRPSYSQISPTLAFIPDQDCYIIGNTGLEPTIVQEISLDYISRYHWGSNALVFDLGANYYRVDDRIEKQPLLLGTASLSGYAYNSYVNSGAQNIVNGNFMAYYQYNAFSVSLAANIYNSGLKEDDQTTRYTYYNISVMPSFVLANGWSCTLYAAYHSKVETSSSELGSCAFTQLNVGRSFGRWHINFYQKSAFSGKCKDVIYSDGGDKIRKYDLLSSEVGVGVRFMF